MTGYSTAATQTRAIALMQNVSESMFQYPVPSPRAKGSAMGLFQPVAVIQINQIEITLASTINKVCLTRMGFPPVQNSTAYTDNCQVPRGGIEPPTLASSERCSTN